MPPIQPACIDCHFTSDSNSRVRWQPWPGFFGSGSPAPLHSRVAGPSYCTARTRLSTLARPTWLKLPGRPPAVDRYTPKLACAATATPGAPRSETNARTA